MLFSTSIRRALRWTAVVQSELFILLEVIASNDFFVTYKHIFLPCSIYLTIRHNELSLMRLGFSLRYFYAIFRLGMSWSISYGEMHVLSLGISTNVQRKYEYDMQKVRAKC